jgi:site-specific DNA recombinase
VGGHPVNYGYKMNATRDGYEVDQPKMSVVRRIFRLIGEEGLAITAVTKILNKEGEPGPAGGRWNTYAVRRMILEDVYKPHFQEEVAELVSPEVAALLSRGRRYGIWWFNRERWRRTKVSEPSSTGEGRVYRWRVGSVPRPREEWVAVPVPDSGIPRETVDAARHIVANNKPCSSNGDRFWELSGGVLRCSECGRRMRTSVTRKKDGKRYFYYSCASRREGNLSSCSNRKTHRAERIEPAVWDLVSELLTDPERLRVGLDAMMEQERSGVRVAPDHEARAWLERLTEADRMRARYQELAAKGLMTIEELSARLEELEATRKTASDELEAIRRRVERLEGLEQDRDALMEFYAGAVPEDLERVGPEERRRIYEMLRLEISARPDGTFEARGVLVKGLRVGSENGHRVCKIELAPP